MFTFFTLPYLFTRVSRGMDTTFISCASVSSLPTIITSVSMAARSMPTTRKVYIFSFSVAGAPALGSSVGSGVEVACGFSVFSGVAVGSMVCSPSPPRSGGFSQSMYSAAAAQTSASAQQIMSAIFFPALDRRLGAGFPPLFALFPSPEGPFFFACAPESFPFIFMPQPLSVSDCKGPNGPYIV